MSSSVQATPRRSKRTAAHFDEPETPTATARKRRAGIPTPNPPYAPFPTPQSTRSTRSTRRAKFDAIVESDVEATPTPAITHSLSSSVDTPGPEATPSSSSSSAAPFTPHRTLPSHLQSILTLHHAFNVVLNHHIATRPPVLPPHPASTTLLQLPNLTNILAIRDAVERTAGKRFTTQELARLAWIWTWDGETLPAETSAQKKKEDDNPFLVKPSVPSSNATQVSGLSYLITTTRTICPKTARRVHTHGVGIELDLQPGETRQVLMGGGEGGIGNQGVGGGVRVLGRWSAGGEMREDVVRKRLERWVELNGGDLDATPKANTSTETTCHLPTPTTRESERSEIPPIPLLPLPKLPSAVLPGSPAARLFAASSSSTPGPSLPPAFATPKKTSIPGLSDPFEFVEKKPPTTPKSSLEDRRRAMEERIKARSQSAQATRTTLAGALNSPGVIHHRLSASQQQEELRRRSMLSRLEGIAEGVWMMFSGPSAGASSLSSSPRGRRRAIPMREVADMIVKSSKTPISDAEAQGSLKLLTELCPFFLTHKIVAKQEWLEMPPALTLPPSPGPAAVAVAVPASPQSSPARRLVSPPLVTGPASPGRVRRTGGLQQVRERIRRELGEF